MRTKSTTALKLLSSTKNCALSSLQRFEHIFCIPKLTTTYRFFSQMSKLQWWRDFHQLYLDYLQWWSNSLQRLSEFFPWWRKFRQWWSASRQWRLAFARESRDNREARLFISFSAVFFIGWWWISGYMVKAAMGRYDHNATVTSK
jgi:hypothetical protein